MQLLIPSVSVWTLVFYAIVNNFCIRLDASIIFICNIVNAFHVCLDASIIYNIHTLQYNGTPFSKDKTLRGSDSQNGQYLVVVVSEFEIDWNILMMFSFFVSGSSKCVKARKERSMQTNRLQETNTRGITSCSAKRTVPGESCNSSPSF